MSIHKRRLKAKLNGRVIRAHHGRGVEMFGVLFGEQAASSVVISARFRACRAFVARPQLSERKQEKREYIIE